MADSKNLVLWLGIAGSIASLIGLAVVFIPKGDTPQQQLSASSNSIAGQSQSGNVTINVGPNIGPAKIKQPLPYPGEIDYRDLANPAISPSLVGKDVLFRAMFIGEWNLVMVYTVTSMHLEGKVFLNHRGVYDTPTQNGIGYSDSEIPPFPLFIEAAQIASIRSLHGGDYILVHGHVSATKPPSGYPPVPDFAKISVLATNITKLPDQ